MGDRRALDALLRRHLDRVATLCRRITGNDADADDATQQALLAIVKGLPLFDGRSAFSTWAYRVATNACLDEIRRRRRRPEPLATVPERSHPGPQSAVDLRIDIDSALLGLPLEFRAPVVLRDLCGLDYAEIADTLGTPVGTVKSRIARGRAALATRLGPVPGNPPASVERPSP